MLAARAAKMIALAQPHFDKYQRAAIIHDQVDFTHAATVISRHQFESLSLQECGGKIFRLLAGLDHGVNGAASPSRNTASTPSRLICCPLSRLSRPVTPSRVRGAPAGPACNSNARRQASMPKA